MKKLILSIIILMFGLVYLSCSKKEVEVEKVKSAASQYHLSMLHSSTDPVCNMQLTNHTIQDTVHYHDKVYGFCSTACRDSFLTDPESHLPGMHHSENKMMHEHE